MKYFQMTITEDPRKMLKTEYGNVNFEEWLVKEHKRLRMIGVASAIRKSKDGDIALFAERINLKQEITVKKLVA